MNALKAKLWFLIATIGVLCFDSDAMAYSPRRDVEVEIRFANLSNFPDHDFYLRYMVSPGEGKWTAVAFRVVSDQDILIKARSSSHLSDVVLLAVPRNQKVDVPDLADQPLKWLDQVPAGAIQSAGLSGRPEGGAFPGPPFARVKITFEVALNGQSLEVRCIKRIDPPTPLIVYAYDLLPFLWLTIPVCAFGFLLIVLRRLAGNSHKRESKST